MLGFYWVFLFILSYSLTWLLRRYALVANLMDIPNHRSSHLVPTPRGGGVSFVVCFLTSVVFLFYLKFISSALFFTLIIGGSFIAMLGFLDDRNNISAQWRLSGHFAASIFALYLLGGMPSIPFFAWTLTGSLVTSSLAVLYLVWLLNLYNFMDGIDGIAAVEAITVLLGGGMLYYLSGHFNELFLPLCLMFAVAGFLCWNFPPARIFMGDAGSGFLGFVLGVLSIQAATIDGHFFWGWLILSGVFITDATICLLRRAMRGESLFQAHRSHAYQYAARYYGKHLPVTLGVLLINLLWLLPIAIGVGCGIVNGGLGLLIAYLPLIGLALKFQSGKKE
ncbi:MraY family glycosyltransferase [Legionella fairfieldensis]|uniref:MraY family glycosyltransferase n=1 Tax=Legionella fairfieldensis TaxID=45064 RepID=UPI00048F2BE3|nr:glycosyltransferase family 4 protein [Legionella fairfieldensis]